MDLLYDTLFNGLAIGSVLVLAALGLAVVFGLMGVINMAHGELMMLGAYTTFVVQNLFKNGPLEGLFPIYILVAIPLAFLVSGLAGLLLEKTVIRRLYGRPLETLLATWGVSLILQQFVRSVSSAFVVGLVVAVALGLVTPRLWPSSWAQRRWTPLLAVATWVISGLIGIILASGLGGVRVLDQPWFSARNLDVTAPLWLRGSVELGGVNMPTARLFIVALTAIALVAVHWFLQKSVWGIRIRAVTQNRSMSDCLGIPTETVYGLAANAFDELAVASIFSAKNRPHFDPLIVHCSSLEEVVKCTTEFPAPLLKLAQQVWPGPLTLLLPKQPFISDLVTAGSSLCAFRVPNHPLTLEVLKSLLLQVIAYY